MKVEGLLGHLVFRVRRVDRYLFQASGFRDWVCEFWVEGLGVRAWGLGFGV